MRRISLLFLAILIAVSATTFAGMALFGMDHGMTMDHETCVGAACDAMPGDASGLVCLDHCLAAVPFSGPTQAFFFLVVLSIVGMLLPVAARRTAHFRSAISADRFREGIGKRLLQQRLSTVILRN